MTVLAGSVLAAPVQGADRPLRVTATLSTFADLVRQIGGNRVEVSHVASPRFNPHFIEPRPSDVLRVKKAGLFIHAGLDLELWRDPLLEAAGNLRLFPGREGALDLSQGIPLLEVPDRPVTRLMGDIHIFGNPHYWLSPSNLRVMAQAIAGKLCAVDPAHAEEYRSNLQSFLARLDRKIPEWEGMLSPYKGRELIGYHNEWPYLMQFAGLKMEQFVEPKPGIPPAPRHLSFLEGYVRERGIRVIVQATFYSRAASEDLARRTGARVVLLCQNVGEIPEAKDIFFWMEYNVKRLAQALEGSA